MDVPEVNFEQTHVGRQSVLGLIQALCRRQISHRQIIKKKVLRLGRNVAENHDFVLIGSDLRAKYNIAKTSRQKN